MLLRKIAVLESLDAGTLTIDAVRSEGLAPAQRNLAMASLFDQPGAILPFRLGTKWVGMTLKIGPETPVFTILGSKIEGAVIDEQVAPRIHRHLRVRGRHRPVGRDVTCRGPEVRAFPNRMKTSGTGACLPAVMSLQVFDVIAKVQLSASIAGLSKITGSSRFPLIILAAALLAPARTDPADHEDGVGGRAARRDLYARPGPRQHGSLKALAADNALRLAGRVQQSGLVVEFCASRSMCSTRLCSTDFAANPSSARSTCTGLAPLRLMAKGSACPRRRCGPPQCPTSALRQLHCRPASTRIWMLDDTGGLRQVPFLGHLIDVARGPAGTDASRMRTPTLLASARRMPADLCPRAEK